MCIYDWISICAYREIIMNATIEYGRWFNDPRTGEMGGNLRGDETLRITMRPKRISTRAEFGKHWPSRREYYYTQVWHQRIQLCTIIYYTTMGLLVVIINSRKMCSMMHRNSVKTRINITYTRSTTITKYVFELLYFLKVKTITPS